jgi:hypothetical protein
VTEEPSGPGRHAREIDRSVSEDRTPAEIDVVESSVESSRRWACRTAT